MPVMMRQVANDFTDTNNQFALFFWGWTLSPDVLVDKGSVRLGYTFWSWHYVWSLWYKLVILPHTSPTFDFFVIVMVCHQLRPRSWRKSDTRCDGRGLIQIAVRTPGCGRRMHRRVHKWMKKVGSAGHLGESWSFVVAIRLYVADEASWQVYLVAANTWVE